MRGMNYTRATDTPSTAGSTSSYVAEALAKQAALRPARTPPKQLELTPVLPRMHKPGRKRRKV